MPEAVPLEDIVSKLLTTRSCTREEFKRIYKLLCKYTHPDLTGKDGRDFIRLTEIYTKLQEREAASVLTDNFNPNKIIEESGYPRIKDPRAALYISLYRYGTSGMNAYKIRSKEVLRERNSLIIRTVLYWGSKYDREFVPIFMDYNSKVFEHIRVSSSMKQELKGKRMFLDGLDWFFKYQDTGRSSSGTISRDKLKGSIYTFHTFGCRNSPVIPFANWLIRELEKAPVRFQHQQFEK